MILKSDLIKKRNIIKEGFDEDLLGTISHDLTIEKIIISTEETFSTYKLLPQKTVFIQCDQVIKLPNDLIGLVHEKNSRIRQGLQISSPIYQPGHHTKIFFRLTNISSKEILLKTGDKIAQISFEEVKGDPDIAYEGEFQNEFDYKGLGKYNEEYKNK